MRTRFFFFLALASNAPLAVACGAVTFALEAAFFAGQTNIIVWDEATKTEHFVRNAKFTSTAGDLGFLAPSPSLPTLVEVDEVAFETLASAVAEFERKVKESKLTIGCSGAATEDAAGVGSVEELQTIHVAGYVATTLKASDPAALSIWMKKNGYASTPQIQKWSDFYIKKGWLLTAFKVNSELGSGETGTVMMSFTTDRPFNPYYVPKENFPRPNDVK
jgi:hypothetical protein